MAKNKALKSKNSQHFLCVELLRKFSKKEIERLMHFVESRYFNSDEYVVRLLDILKKKYWISRNSVMLCKVLSMKKYLPKRLIKRA